MISSSLFRVSEQAKPEFETTFTNKIPLSDAIPVIDVAVNV